MSAEGNETGGKEIGAQTEATLVGGALGFGQSFQCSYDGILSGGRASASQKEIYMDRNSDRVRRSLFRAVDQIVLRVARRATLFGFAGGRGLWTSQGSGAKMGEEFSRWTQQRRQLHSLEINRSRG